MGNNTDAPRQLTEAEKNYLIKDNTDIQSYNFGLNITANPKKGDALDKLGVVKDTRLKAKITSVHKADGYAMVDMYVTKGVGDAEITTIVPTKVPYSQVKDRIEAKNKVEGVGKITVTGLK